MERILNWEEAAALLARKGVFVPPREMSGLRALTVEAPCSIPRCELFGTISVGAYTYVGRNSELRDVTLGRFCSVARNVMIGPTEHPTQGVTTHPVAFGGGDAFKSDPYFARMMRSREADGAAARTVIGADCWLGDRVFIRRGAAIGSGAVLAAAAVVTRDVAPYAVVAGVPARHLRDRLPREVAQRLLATSWWELDLSQAGVDLRDAAAALPALEAARANAGTPALRPERFVLRRVEAKRWAIVQSTAPDA